MARPGSAVDDLLGYRVAPTTPAEESQLPVPELLADLFPNRGLQRGWSVGFGGVGGWAAALALLGPALEGDGWAAGVGIESLGLVAAEELGVRLDRLLVVESPGPHAAEVVAALIEAVDVICLGPDVRVGARSARRLAARAREQGTVFFHLGDPGEFGKPGFHARSRWPEAFDVELHVASGEWAGIGTGHGYLQSRLVVVEACGRRSMAQSRRIEVLLPGPDGAMAAASSSSTASSVAAAPSSTVREVVV